MQPSEALTRNKSVQPNAAISKMTRLLTVLPVLWLVFTFMVIAVSLGEWANAVSVALEDPPGRACDSLYALLCFCLFAASLPGFCYGVCEALGER